VVAYTVIMKVIFVPSRVFLSETSSLGTLLGHSKPENESRVLI